MNVKTSVTTPSVIKTSERIAAQIEEAKNRIAGLNTELSGVEQQFALLAAEESIDEAAVENLRKRKIGILADLDLFHQRVGIFQTKKAAAEKSEAQARVEEIEAATRELSEQGAKTLERFRGALSSAEQALGELSTFALAGFRLLHEAQLLQFQHLLPQPNLAAIPKVEVEDADLKRLTNAVYYMPRNPAYHDDEHIHALNRLKGQRAKEEQPRKQEQPGPMPASKSEPLPVRETITIPARPEEDHRQLNRMQQLLRG